MDLTRLLPHGPPLRLLTRVDAVDGERVVAHGRIPRDAPGSDGVSAPALLGVELGAQSTAMIAAAKLAAVGSSGEEEPAPRIGYLVSLRSISLRVESLPVEVDLRVEARRVGGAGGFERFEVAVTLPGESAPAVEGVIGTMLTDQRLDPSPA